jgi:predicted amidophosphoribosyltransferase
VASVRELSDPYANFMLNPLAPASPDVCRVCATFTQGFATCYPCGHQPAHADAVLPISYSVHERQLHTALAVYKRGVEQAARPLRAQLAAVLWRFLDRHEACLAQHVGVAGFDIVTAVPSGVAGRDEAHPLRDVVGRLVAPTRDRYERLLTRSEIAVAERTVDAAKYAPTRTLAGEHVLLIDDTWVTGANVQSAAGALKAAGAGRVGVVVIGRHVHAEFGDNAARLRALPRRFDWDRCALERG